VLAGPIAKLVYEPKPAWKRMVHPPLEQFEGVLRLAEALWFWGHGDQGGLWISKGVFFSLSDVRRVALARPTPLRVACLRACHSLYGPEAESSWLQLAERVQGFHGATVEWWGRVNPMVEATRRATASRERTRGEA
jgi:hypothetical protein